MQKVILIVFILLQLAFAVEPPAEFFNAPGGVTVPWTLPGFASSPARLAAPSFGFSYGTLPDVDEAAYGLSLSLGEESFRFAFLGTFSTMDSVYRRVYVEGGVSANAAWGKVGGVLGAAYGLSMEMMPGEVWWTRHRCKFGASGWYGHAYLSGMLSGYGDDLENTLGYVLGLFIRSSERFYIFGEYNGEYSDVGTMFSVGRVSIRSAYRFPGIGLSLGVTVDIGSWSLEGLLGQSFESFAWFGGAVQKRLRKKDYLVE